MLYIHSLKDLNNKSAEIESVYLIREIKRKTPPPFNEGKLLDYFSLFFVSKTDLENMSQALELIPNTIKEIEELPKGSGDYELLNIKRACSALTEIFEPLKNNITFAMDISEWQDSSIIEMAALLKGIPALRSNDEKMVFEKRIGAVVEKVLRNREDFMFNANDIINEAHTSRGNYLKECVDKGSFFHVKLEEYIQRQDFNAIAKRLPKEDLERFNSINKNITVIKEGLERAYESNMRMISFAITFYAFIKIVRG